jgi:putative ABC transport system substrate-binding protein
MDKRNCIIRTFLTGLITVSLSYGAPIKIGVGWPGKSEKANDLIASFDTEIKKLIPDIDIEYKKELVDIKAFATVVKDWEKTKNGMVVLHSGAVSWLGKNPPAIPTFVGVCNNPVGLGAMKSLDKPDGNITGTTYIVPISLQFTTFKAILPNLKNIVLVVDKTNPSSIVDKEQTESVCKEFNLTFKVIEGATINEITEAVKTVTNDNTAIMLGYQPSISENTKIIVSAAKNIPIFSFDPVAVTKGALAGFVSNDKLLGLLLAQSVTEVLKNGKKIADIPVKLDLNPKLKINKTTMLALGLQIPLNIIKRAELVE